MRTCWLHGAAAYLGIVLFAPLLAHADETLAEIRPTPPAAATPSAAGSKDNSPAANKAKPIGKSDQLVFDQSKVAAQMSELEERMFRLSESLKSLEPENSSRLMLGLKYAREELILHQMEDTQKALGDKSLVSAIDQQKLLLTKLDRLQALLLSSDLDFQMRLERLRQMREILRQLAGAIKEEDREQKASDQLAKKEAELARLQNQRQALEELIRRQKAHNDSAQKLASSNRATPSPSDQPATPPVAPENQPENSPRKQDAPSEKSADSPAGEKEASTTKNADTPDEASKAEEASPAAAKQPGAEGQPGASPADAVPPPPLAAGDVTKPAAEADSASALVKTQQVTKSDTEALADSMRGSGASASENLGNASNSMKQGVESLSSGKVAESLPPLDEALASLEKELVKVAAEQKKLQAALEAEKFAAIKRDQSANRKTTDSLAEMSRSLGDSGAGAMSELQKASSSMGSAEKQLADQKAMPAEEDQAKALASLKYAKKQLEGEAEKLLEELRAEVKKRVQEDLTAMLEKQRAIREATEALAPKVEASSRQAMTAAVGLSKSEAQIKNMAIDLIALVEETEFGIALPAALGVVRDQMQGVETALSEGQATPDTIDAEKRIEEDLQGLLDAMKRLPSNKAQPGKAKKGSPRERERELNRLVAELKMIRLLQVRVGVDTQGTDKRRGAEELEAASSALRRKIEALHNRQDNVEGVTKKLALEQMTDEK